MPRKFAPYMGALAGAGWEWFARGDTGYGGKWAGLARRGRCTPRIWAQRPVRVHCRLSYTTVQATIALARLWLVLVKTRKFVILLG